MAASDGDQKLADTRGLRLTDQTAGGSMRPLLPRPEWGLKPHLTSPLPGPPHTPGLGEGPAGPHR